MTLVADESTPRDESDRPGRARLRVSVTGHRAIDVSSGSLRARIVTVLDSLSPGVPATLRTALAQGADQLVASCAQELGWALDVVFPTTLELYRRTLGADATVELDRLLSAAARATDPESVAAVPRVLGAGSTGDYVALAQDLTTNVDVLVALYDPLRQPASATSDPGALGWGGTEHVMAMAVEAGVRVVCVAPDGDHEVTEDSGLSERLLLARRALLPELETADSDAVRRKRELKPLAQIIAYSGPLAVGLAAFPLVFVRARDHNEPTWLVLAAVLEALVLVGAIVLATRWQRQRRLLRWIEARSRAEYLRGEHARLVVAAPPYHAELALDALEQLAATACSVRFDAGDTETTSIRTGLSTSRPVSPIAVAWYRRIRVLPQVEYMRSYGRDRERFAHKWHVRARMCVGAAVFGAVVHVAEVGTRLARHAGETGHSVIGQLAVFVALVAPALAAAFTTIGGTVDQRADADRFRATQTTLLRLCYSGEPATAWIPAVELVLAKEHIAWRASAMARDIEPG